MTDNLRSVCPKCGEKLTVPHPQATETTLGTATLAGSSDDRLVTLALASSESPTEHMPSSVAEALLRAGDSPSGRYVEQGVIAQGGMGEIVLCIDRDIRRPVALKRMLTATADDPSRRARFIEEAQVTGQLEHPNIVPVHELTRRDDGSVYFTMKLVKGKSLADILGEMKAASAGEPPLGKGGFPRTPSPKPSDSPLPRGEVAQRAGDGAAPADLPTLSELLQIFLKVCDGVAFAHSRGVIHRDLKPANIMVGDFGEVLVMDWGLAKVKGREDVASTRVAPTNLFVGGPKEKATGTPANEFASATPGADRVFTSRLEKESTPTIEGSMIGTPAYMPPEQAEGKLEQIDERSDIYSLGAILYEMLALERAIQGETQMAVILNVVKGNILAPEQRAPTRNIPRELSAIAMKCLSKPRARRYHSVLDLKRDIGLFLEGRSVSAAPDTFSQAVVKLVKRNKGVSAAVGAAAVVLLTMGALFTYDNAKKRWVAENALKASQESERKAVAAQQQQRATALAASKRQAESAVRATSEGRFDEASARASAAVEVMPDGPWGHYALGVLANEKKDIASARKHLEEALRIDPAHGPSKLLHATVIASTGNLAQWEKLAAETDKCTDWKALVAAGDVLFASLHYSPSIRAYERAVALMGNDKGIAQPLVAETREKAQRSIACVKTEDFYESIRSLPSTEQASRIAAVLREIYHFPAIQGGVVDSGVPGAGGLSVNMFHAGNLVRWIDPFRGLPLTSLYLRSTQVRDLEPLRGMPLKYLNLEITPVADISPLRGMPLTELRGVGEGVSDLSPLAGMPLKLLWCGGNQVSDLTPLRGMPLTELCVNNAPVSDLSPLIGMKLTVLNCRATRIGDLRPLRGMPLGTLDCSYCYSIRDLSPLKGLALKEFYCDDSGGISDLSPLSGMPLVRLSVLHTGVTDLTPLAGMKLKEFRPPAKKQLTPESLKVVEELEKLGCKVNWTE